MFVLENMRIGINLLAARGNPREPVPFQEILPLQLKDKVSGKGNKVQNVCCIHEMSIMFACFKTNEFDQSLCSKEIDSFQKCYSTHMEKSKVKQEKEAKGILTPGEKSLSAKQLNLLLSRYINTK